MSIVTAKKQKDHVASWKMTPGKFLLYAFMYIFAIICLVPLIWLVRTGFVPKQYELDLFAIGWVPTLSNFTRIWSMAPWANYYLNTILLLLMVLGAQFITITLSGYAFARLNFYGKNFLFVLFLTQIMIAADVLILPNYLTITRIGLNNTILGAAMPFFASAMGTFLVRQTVKTIPYELEEAAKIDGCNLFRTLVQIYLPLLVPCYIAHFLIAGSYQWNNFLWPLIVINNPSKRLITVGLAIFAQASEIGALWSDTCAATLLAVAPLLILFFLFQRRFIESFAYSGIK